MKPQQATSAPRTVATPEVGNSQIGTFPAAPQAAPEIETFPAAELTPQVYATPLPAATKAEPHVTPIPEQQKPEAIGGGFQPVEAPADTNVMASSSGKASSNGKNEAHGDAGRAVSKADKQIEALEEKLQTATGRERKLIEKKIKNIRQSALKKRRGENHSMKAKR